MKWIVDIIETLQRRIEVNGETSEDAAKNAEQQYRDGEIVLDSADYVGTEFVAVSAICQQIPQRKCCRPDFA